VRDFVCGERAEEEEFRRGGGEVQAKVVNEVDAERVRRTSRTRFLPL
jgi:hypothetical protein